MVNTWQGLVNQPTFHTSSMILLSDGIIMMQEEAKPYWHALTPDSNGGYVNGTWSTLADMSFWTRCYASGIPKDRRVIIVGASKAEIAWTRIRAKFLTLLPTPGVKFLVS
jgi:hypothetical protein